MARIATTIEAVLSAVKARVLAYCPVSLPDSASTYLTLAEDKDQLDNAVSDRFVTVRPMSFGPMQGVVAGAGAGLFVTESTIGVIGQIPLEMLLQVNLWLRLETDEQNADDDFLTNATNGALPLWRRILGALQLYDPTSGPDKILCEPMRLAAPTSKPTKTRRTDFGKLESYWQTVFVCQTLDHE
jgi:hypothetical protein